MAKTIAAPAAELKAHTPRLLAQDADWIKSLSALTIGPGGKVIQQDSWKDTNATVINEEKDEKATGALRSHTMQRYRPHPEPRRSQKGYGAAFSPLRRCGNHHAGKDGLLHIFSIERIQTLKRY
jgi:polyribonucleotide nucleotidyltransferase